MSETENRSSRLTIRLSDRERADLKGKADKLGFDESEYVRQILGERQIKQTVIPQVNRDTYLELTQLKIEINRQGVNFNQLVKLANSHQDIPSEMDNQLRTLIETYERLQMSLSSYQSQVLDLGKNDREN